MNLVTITTRRLLEQAFRESVRQPRLMRCPVGTTQWKGDQELFVRALNGEAQRYLHLSVGNDLSSPRSLPQGVIGLLMVGRGLRRGRAQGYVQVAADLRPIDRLKIVGPGMHILRLQSSAAGQASGPEVSHARRERWSRTIGALGLDVYRRLVGLSYGIIGLGRTGSIIADALSYGWGVTQILAIDPDVVETVNLGEMSIVGESDCGLIKSQAVARHLVSSGGLSPRVTAVETSITHVRAMHAIQTCDALFGCVDSDGARLATSALATLFCKPYLDIATGIHGEGAGRQMGIDIRMVLPGERCLLCMGGIADPTHAWRMLSSAEAEQEFYAYRHWRQERAGSLRSLNQLAASVALRLWEDFVAERVAESTWIHIEFDHSGRMGLYYEPVNTTSTCRLCQLAGMAQDGLSPATEFFCQRAGH
jgi:molybdopterin/thiamine biosynthesis adenylyltransferase